MISGREIGLRIKKNRESRSISQQRMVEELEELGLKISRETLSKIENGNRNISAPELKAVCKVMKIDIDSLLSDEEDDEELVKLFRKKNVTEETLEEIADLEIMIVSFLKQKEIVERKINISPLWRR